MFDIDFPQRTVRSRELPKFMLPMVAAEHKQARSAMRPVYAQVSRE